MIFINVHDNSNNIPNEKDITFCLASFEPENVNLLTKISFCIEEEVYQIIFNIDTELKTFPYNCLNIFLRCENIDTLFQNFSKASKFAVEKKLSHKTKTEFVTHDYSLVDKIMLLGGYWKNV